MAALPSSVSGISTKPKPLDTPLYLSVMILIVSTRPNCSNSCRNSSSVVSRDRLPTCIFKVLPSPGRSPIKIEVPVERQLFVPGAVGCILVDLWLQAFCMLNGLHERGNCLLAPHFLQIPAFFPSINQ